MAAERHHGIGHGRRQARVVLDRTFIEGAALRGIKVERATEIDGAPSRVRGDQRNGNAGGVTAGEGGGPPRSHSRVRPDIIDPTRAAGPSRNADGPLTDVRLAPGRLEALQVDAVS